MGNRKLVFYLLEQPRLNLTCQHQCFLSILHTIKPLISPTVSTHFASRINLSNQTWHRPGFAIIRWWLMLKIPIYPESPPFGIQTFYERQRILCSLVVQRDPGGSFSSWNTGSWPPLKHSYLEDSSKPQCQTVSAGTTPGPWRSADCLWNLKQW